MKRLTSLALLLVLLFNTGGYLLFFQLLIYCSDTTAERHINRNQFKPAELEVVKVPLQLPAVVNWENYEQIEGQMSLKGHNYNFVGLKITRDTMFLLCLPNKAKNRLVNDYMVYAQQVNDSPQAKKTQGLLKISFPLLKYNFETLQFRFMVHSQPLEKPDTPVVFHIDNPVINAQERPPAFSA
jgi:hypothetical protein